MNKVVLPHATSQTTTVLIGSVTVTFLVAQNWWNRQTRAWVHCPNLACHAITVKNSAASTVQINIINAVGQHLLTNWRVNGFTTDRNIILKYQNSFVPGHDQICKLLVEDIHTMRSGAATTHLQG